MEQSDLESERQDLSVDGSISSTRETSPMELVYETPRASTRQNKNSIVQLIEEATRYDMKSEYSLPKSFLRDRSKMKKFQSVEYNDYSEKDNTKQKVRKNSKAVETQKTHGSKVRSLVTEQTVKVSKKKEVKRKSLRAKTCKTNEPIGWVQNSCTEIQALEQDCVNDNKEYFMSNPDVLMTIPSTFFTVDVDSMDATHTTLQDTIIHSTALSGEKDGHIVKIYSVLFKDLYEEFLIDFVSKLERYNPILEAGQTIEANVRIYFPQQFKADGMTLVKKLNDAYERLDGGSFRDLINDYNRLVQRIPSILVFQHLKTVKTIPTSFLYNVLTTCYTRAIYPNAKRLRKYASFSNFVYGELMPEFLTKAYKQCGLKPGDVFLDLGSGVGNCVLQSALEFGCSISFGCEIMDSASELTEIHLKELQNRCKMLGIKLNTIEFSLRKSFVDNERVHELIQRCDVLLINNFIFDPPLNKKVEKIVQGLKPGAKIISLKSIRPSGYTINYDDIENIFNKMKVESFPLPENSVSWTHRSVGHYYISTVQEDIDETIFHAPIFGKIRSRKPLRYTR